MATPNGGKGADTIVVAGTAPTRRRHCCCVPHSEVCPTACGELPEAAPGAAPHARRAGAHTEAPHTAPPR